MKKHSLGFELEAFLIDEKGGLKDGATSLLAGFGRKKPFILEVADSMVEFNTTPHEWSLGSISSMFYRIARVEKKSPSALLPLGCYPGRTAPRRHSKGWYDLQSAVLGPAFDYYSTRVCGFHFHYGLPKGGLMPGNARLRIFKDSAHRKSILSMYDFLVAADPALSCLMQSSPFFEGQLLGKDARAFAYRDMRHPMGYGYGLYHEQKELGGLPKYANTLTDLNDLALSRKKSYIASLRQASAKVPKWVQKANPLKFFWGPLRVNKIGTLEQRGMDANLPQRLIAAASTLNAVLKRIFYGKASVRQSDSAVARPFSFDGEYIRIPPNSYVANVLQPAAALKGLEDARVRNYCSSFYRLAHSFQKEDGTVFLGQAFQKSLADGRTVSDDIIALAKRRGWRKGEPLADDAAQDIALEYALKMKIEVYELTEVARGWLSALDAEKTAA
ncbi:MAG: hypothetical protein V1787_05955 [Candidatus Micrarchaeota archaeon]